MKISNISNINYKGIKVLNREPESANSKQQEIYRNMSETFEMLGKMADSLDITTKSEAEDAINEEYYHKSCEKKDELEKRYQKSYQRPIKAIKTHSVERKIDKEKEEKLSQTKPSSKLELKNQIVTTMDRIFTDAVKRIEEIDGNRGQTNRDNDIDYCKATIASRMNTYRVFSKIAGYEYEKSVLEDVFISKVQMEQEGKDVEVPGSILFFGPYNNGKTYTTKIVARDANCRTVKIKPIRSKELVPILYDEAQKAQEHFKSQGQRTIIFIDELDRKIHKGSPEISEFEEFIQTCSEKYHCSVFATTNYPSQLGLNMNNPNIFPIRMSIDTPNNENLKVVLKYYLEGSVQKDIDYDIIIDEIRKKEHIHQGKYSNRQISMLPSDAVELYGHANLTQEELISFIENYTEPVLDKEELKQFDDEYKKFIGVQE